jgi:acid phosphatase
MRLGKTTRIAIALMVLVAASMAAEPTNLDLRKRELRGYHDTGAYQREIADVVTQVRAWVEQRVAQRKPGERLAMVFDLDETLISNWPFMIREDFGGSDAAWDAWYESAEAPAIPAVRDLFRFVRERGIEAIIVTGRNERWRAVTVKNLRAIGCAEETRVVFRPNDSQGPVAAYKTAERKRLVDEGWTIVANIGDQQSDLANGFAERTFKLPNPFYLLE